MHIGDSGSNICRDDAAAWIRAERKTVKHEIISMAK